MKAFPKVRGTIPPSRAMFAFLAIAALLYFTLRLAPDAEGVYLAVLVLVCLLLVAMMGWLLRTFIKDKPKTSAVIEMSSQGVSMQVNGEIEPIKLAQLAGKAYAFVNQDPARLVPRSSGTVKEGPNNELIAVPGTDGEIEERYQEDLARVTALQSEVSQMLAILAIRKPMLPESSS